VNRVPRPAQAHRPANAEVRAARAYGGIVRINRPEHAVWGLRLLAEAGELTPVHVDAPSAPSDVGYAERLVYEGFQFLLGVKWLYEYGAPSAFAWRFASAWSGVSARHAGAAINKLRTRELLEVVGMHGKTPLYLPGIGKTRATWPGERHSPLAT
jgi:hypothetical protein